MQERRKAFNSGIFKRRSIRLKGWDYKSPGHYFITICTHNRECLFGEITGIKMEMNDAGHVVERCWLNIPTHFPHVSLDEFIVMPNHVHGIIAITRSVGGYNHTPRRLDRQIKEGAKDFSPQPDNLMPRSPSKTIGSIIRGFKVGAGEWFRKNTDMSAIWQRNYYEHIIRDEAELDRIRQYIRDNPAKWLEDEENPEKECLWGKKIRRGV